ncbi:MAG TPA: hypothetical protein VKA94_13855 [Hyphomicrobiales bacterium]|nr:hypothetical protein [Hyphomicrobiales bacterium]
MSKLINITAPQHRCDISVSCPAVYRSEDGGSFTIIGTLTSFQDHPEIADRTDTENGEAAVDIPADLLLASLGLPALIEAAEPILKNLNFDEEQHQELYEEPLEDNEPVLVPAGRLRALRNLVNRIQGGDNG